MNIKASHVEKYPITWCKYKKELVHLPSFNTDCHTHSVSSQETELPSQSRFTNRF